ncbi:MAG TPA: enoyl-CoA hydratase/isomerase family protein [Stellaceae bacterium]|nr:enoyl-CoA hydratase/isomerase family protein [Stellaceae bacterium]
MSDDEILLERRGGLGIVTLNRPQALNTLSLGMYRRFDPAIAAWASDPGVRAVVVRGAGERAFCAGGDVVTVYHARAQKAGPGDYKADFFREEYQLIRRIHRLPKPAIALMDGVTMGGGVGVSVNGRFRIATERTLLAMPEVHIGLFPDVGASRFLNLCPERIGLYLALTGKRIGAADALLCGFATHFVPHERLAALTEALAAPASDIETVLAFHAADPGPAPLDALRAAIDRCFGGASVEAIVSALAREDAPWGAEAREAVARASPLSLKITFHQLGLGVGMDVEAALALEYRMTQHCMAGHDFYEGIRALLVDKDRNPSWQHRDLAEVSAAEVESYFASIGDRELRFD